MTLKARSQTLFLGKSNTKNDSSNIDPNRWNSKLKPQNNKENAVLVVVVPPADSVIGNYELSIETRRANQKPTSADLTTVHTEKFVLLFNPWSKDDLVYMENKSELEEYVLNDSGVIFIGSKVSIHSLPWNYGQFDELALPCALYLMEISNLDEAARGNPAKVSRMLSAMVNYNDRDGGILYGRWTETYPKNATRPTAWVGSTEILQKFWRKKYMVRYGQCWVFAGVLCTLSRALGIPCRCVTNFDSAHDTDGSHSVDFHFSKEGKPVEDLNDSIWNFHVWNEVWMRRPDLPEGHDGWQAVDATPQETSEGVYQAGPASVAAIRNAEVYLPYDTGFVFAEVNADKVYWTVDENAETMEAEGSKEERDTARRAFRYGNRKDYSFLKGMDKVDSRAKGEEVGMFLEMPDSGMIGDTIEVNVLLRNNEKVMQTVNLNLSTRLVFYTGVSAGVVDDRTEVVELKSEGEKNVTVKILPDMYLEQLEGSAGDLQLKVYARVLIVKTGRILFDQDSFDFEKPHIDIQVKDKLVVGKGTDVELNFFNPLPIALTDCEFHVEGICTRTDNPCFVWQLRQGVQPKSKAVYVGNVTPSKGGRRILVAGFQSDQLSGLSGKKSVEIFDES